MLDTFVLFNRNKSKHTKYIINGIAEVIDFHLSLLYRFLSADKRVWQIINAYL